MLLYASRLRPMYVFGHPCSMAAIQLWYGKEHRGSRSLLVDAKLTSPQPGPGELDPASARTEPQLPQLLPGATVVTSACSSARMLL